MLDIKENFFTDEAEFVHNAWRCDACGRLIYNLKNSYPASGAPIPKYVNSEYKQVCTLCYDMHWTLKNRPYWVNLPEPVKYTPKPDPWCEAA